VSSYAIAIGYIGDNKIPQTIRLIVNVARVINGDAGLFRDQISYLRVDHVTVRNEGIPFNLLPSRLFGISRRDIDSGIRYQSTYLDSWY
jgi:hypothetical protein